MTGEILVDLKFLLFQNVLTPMCEIMDTLQFLNKWNALGSILESECCTAEALCFLSRLLLNDATDLELLVDRRHTHLWYQKSWKQKVNLKSHLGSRHSELLGKY